MCLVFSTSKIHYRAMYWIFYPKKNRFSAIDLCVNLLKFSISLYSQKQLEKHNDRHLPNPQSLPPAPLPSPSPPPPPPNPGHSELQCISFVIHVLQCLISSHKITQCFFWFEALFKGEHSNVREVLSSVGKRITVIHSGICSHKIME